MSLPVAHPRVDSWKRIANSRPCQRTLRYENPEGFIVGDCLRLAMSRCQQPNPLRYSSDVLLSEHRAYMLAQRQ